MKVGHYNSKVVHDAIDVNCLHVNYVHRIYKKKNTAGIF